MPSSAVGTGGQGPSARRPSGGESGALRLGGPQVGSLGALRMGGPRVGSLGALRLGLVYWCIGV